MNASGCAHMHHQDRNYGTYVLRSTAVLFIDGTPFSLANVLVSFKGFPRVKNEC